MKKEIDFSKYSWTQSVKSDLEQIIKSVSLFPNIEKIILFGSFAYGVPHKASDYDICVIVNGNDVDEIGLACDILMKLDIRHAMDLIVYSSDHFNKKASEFNSFESTVSKKGICLYA